MKYLAAAVLFMIAATTVHAKEINLECKYKNLNGGINTQNIMIDPDAKLAGIRSTTTAMSTQLFTDGLQYWFTVNPLPKSNYQVVDFSETYTIDRKTLEFKLEMKLGNTFTGTCEVVNSDNKI